MKSLAKLNNEVELLEDPAAIDNTWNRINSPILYIPLKSSLAVDRGVGSVHFERATTATYIDRYGVMQTAAIDEPRFEKEGLLIEGDSTNLVLQSQSLGTSPWGGGGTTVTNNYGIAPDGTTTTTRLQFGGGDSDNRRQTMASAAGVESTLSCYVKGVIGETLTVYQQGSVTSGVVTLTGEWDYIRHTDTGSTGPIFIATFGGLTARDVEVWGVQLELLPFASSYIPTTTAAATRADEYCYIDSKNNCVDAGADKTVVITNSINPSKEIRQHQFFLFTTSESNSYLEYYYLDNTIVIKETNNGGNQLLTPFIVMDNIADIRDMLTYTYTVQNNQDLSLYLNGELIGTGSEPIDPTTTGSQDTTIVLGAYTATTRHIFGHLRDARIYDFPLTPEEIRLL